MKFMTNEEYLEVLKLEELHNRDYLKHLTYTELDDGFYYSIYLDKRTGEEVAVREIRRVYMGFNSNEEGNLEKFISIVEREGVCEAFWGVTGRTCHFTLSKELEALLPQYRFELGYECYKCRAYKK